jgi:hypothetical protein
MKDEEESEETK